MSLELRRRLMGAIKSSVLYNGSFSLYQQPGSPIIPYKAVLSNIQSGTYTIECEYNVLSQYATDPYNAVSVVAIRAGKSIPSSGDMFYQYKDFVLGVWRLTSGTNRIIQLDTLSDLVIYFADAEYIEACVSVPELNAEISIEASVNVNALKVIKS